MIGLVFEAMAYFRNVRPIPRIQRRMMMEWRVFLPQLEDDIDGWIPEQLKAKYDARLQLLLQSFPMSSQETKVDRHFVGYQHFGIRYRVYIFVLFLYVHVLFIIPYCYDTIMHINT